MGDLGIGGISDRVATGLEKAQDSQEQVIDTVNNLETQAASRAGGADVPAGTAEAPITGQLVDLGGKRRTLNLESAGSGLTIAAHLKPAENATAGILKAFEAVDKTAQKIEQKTSN